MGKSLTKGAAALAEKTRPAPPEITQAELARITGKSRAVVWTWVSGRVLPDAVDMKKIKEATGIPMEWWAEMPPEQTASKGRAKVKRG